MTRSNSTNVFATGVALAIVVAMLCSQPCQAQVPASNRQSQVKVSVTFKNIDSEPIVVHWVDYDGNLNAGTRVEPGKTTGGITGDGNVYVFKKNGKQIQTVTLNKEPQQVIEMGVNIYRYKDAIELGFATKFKKHWADFGSGSKSDGAYYRPIAAPGFHPVGDLAVGHYNNVNGVNVAITVKDISPNQDALRPPVKWEFVWNSVGSEQSADAVIYKPVPPEGYLAMGLVTWPSWNGKPKLEDYRCVRKDLVVPATIGALITSNVGSENDKRKWACYRTNATTTSPGEVAIAPGTFVGAASWGALGAHNCAYCFKLKLPELQSENNFNPPRLTSFARPDSTSYENLARVYVTSVPWFAVNDPQLTDAEKILKSPVYSLVRRDTYRLVDHLYNDTGGNPVLSISEKTGFSESLTKSFESTTGIQFEIGQEAGVEGVSKTSCKLTLSQSFTFGRSTTATKIKETTMTKTIPVSPRTAVAFYQVLSSFTLMRGSENGTQIGTILTGSADNSYFITQYPSEQTSAP